MKLHTPSVVLTKHQQADGSYHYSVDLTVMFQGEYFTYNYDEAPEIAADANGDPLVIFRVERRGSIGSSTLAPLFIHADLGPLSFNGPDGSVMVRVEENGSMATIGAKGASAGDADEDSLGGGD